VQAGRPGSGGCTSREGKRVTLYDTHIDLTVRNSSHTLVAALVDKAPRVLDVGCATGYLARELAALGSRVSGVEVDPEAAELARPHVEQLAVADLDRERLSDHFAPGSFDVVIFADVLEHLRDPAAVLADAGTLLAEGGRVVISVPNVGHAAVRLALLQGRWEYTDTGILDRTHVSFYTRPGFLELVAAAGMEVVDLRGTVMDPLTAPIRLDPEALPPGVVEWVRHQPDALCYQFVAAVRPAGDPPAPAPELVPAVPLARARRRDGFTAAAERRAVHDHADLAERDHLLALQAEVAAARTGVERSAREAERAKAEVARLRAELDGVRASRTWRAGRAVTSPVRALRRRGT
jgi:2-polyprenyl-3-methyl-5-hydroxy-6-metoxy-1,4-benzoquinol methylase